jgi:hypothetical protein
MSTTGPKADLAAMVALNSKHSARSPRAGGKISIWDPLFCTLRRHETLDRKRRCNSAGLLSACRKRAELRSGSRRTGAHRLLP